MAEQILAACKWMDYSLVSHISYLMSNVSFGYRSAASQFPSTCRYAIQIELLLLSLISQLLWKTPQTMQHSCFSLVIQLGKSNVVAFQKYRCNCRMNSFCHHECGNWRWGHARFHVLTFTYYLGSFVAKNWLAWVCISNSVENTSRKVDYS